MSAATENIAITTPAMFTRALIREVAERHGCTYADIMRRDRHRQFVDARAAAIKAVREARPHLSFPQLGRIFGVDHTTIMHHLNRLSEGQSFPHIVCSVPETLGQDGNGEKP